MVGACDLLALSFLAGLVVAVVTTPIGVSGAVFLLPLQVSVLGVPSPAVTPTNLLFNIVAIPGALARYRTQAPLRSPLTAVLLIGTLPGVVLGACIRAFLVPGIQVFRPLIAGILVPLGISLIHGRRHRHAHTAAIPPSRRATIALAFGVGVVGGIYGIGGGSLLSPILVHRGTPLPIVAPAALVCTFITSLVGASAYLILAATTTGLPIAPDWSIGLVAGAGGLVGGYLGARLGPRLPEVVLRIALGAIATATGALYVLQSL